MNPYTVLGINSDATDDEVKKAYRTLSKKYHPDANINNPHQAEYTEKFKQVQTAYKTIMDDRKKGFTSRTYTTGNTGGYQGQSTYQYAGDDQSAYNEAAAYINARRFQEAYSILEQIRNKGDVWFYYAALCENGLGNRIQALEYAKTAYQMNPMNLQYMMLVQQLQGGQTQYQQKSSQYGNPMNMMNCCYTYMMIQFVMACCCGGGRGC